jgi:hypothetical protein
MPFVPGKSGNPNGRPSRDKIADRAHSDETNRKLREKALIELARKFKPSLVPAMKTINRIMMDDKSSEGGQLKAAALIIQTYNSLVKDLYDYRYDEEKAEEVQDTSKAPVFSLRMISDNTENAQQTNASSDTKDS